MILPDGFTELFPDDALCSSHAHHYSYAWVEQMLVLVFAHFK